MTQSELNRAVAKATGETVRTISGMGFVPLPEEPNLPEDRRPLAMDWEEPDARRLAVFPRRHPLPRVA